MRAFYNETFPLSNNLELDFLTSKDIQNEY